MQTTVCWRHKLYASAWWSDPVPELALCLHYACRGLLQLAPFKMLPKFSTIKQGFRNTNLNWRLISVPFTCLAWLIPVSFTCQATATQQTNTDQTILFNIQQDVEFLSEHLFGKSCLCFWTSFFFLHGDVDILHTEHLITQCSCMWREHHDSMEALLFIKRQFAEYQSLLCITTAMKVVSSKTASVPSLQQVLVYLWGCNFSGLYLPCIYSGELG